MAVEIEIGAFVPRDDDEDVHMAIERRLTELCGAPAAKLHTARSRNDQVVTDVRLHLRRVIEGHRDALRGLQELLLARAEPHVETVMPAYTHLQRAQVTSLAHHLLAWFWMLERDRDRFAVALDACLELPLGAGAPLASTTISTAPPWPPNSASSGSRPTRSMPSPIATSPGDYLAAAATPPSTSAASAPRSSCGRPPSSASWRCRTP